MRRSIFTSAFLLVLMMPLMVASQEKTQTIKSNDSKVTVQIDQAPPVPWTVRPNRKNSFTIDVLGGKPRKVRFATDVDSIAFDLKPGDSVPFNIANGEVVYSAEAVGNKFTRSDIKMLSFEAGEKDVKPDKLYGPVLGLEGGGGIGGLQKFIDVVRGCDNCLSKIDVLVIGVDRYDFKAPANDFSDFQGKAKFGFQTFQKMLSPLNGLNSFRYISVVDKKDGDSDEMVDAISKAEVVFFGGGSQCDYIASFRGTRLEKAVEALYQKGGGIGGASAGLAIQGPFMFDGCTTVPKVPMTSATALADPYDKTISFSYDLFNWSILKNSITDTHFVKRDRMGRTLAFLARQIQDGKAKTAYSIAVDEGTSAVVDKNGVAMVVGNGNAYFITADHKPEVCEKGKPLTYSNFKVWRRKPGETFDLKNRPREGYYLVSVKDGKLDRDPY